MFDPKDIAEHDRTKTNGLQIPPVTCKASADSGKFKQDNINVFSPQRH